MEKECHEDDGPEEVIEEGEEGIGQPVVENALEKAHDEGFFKGGASTLARPKK